MRVAITIVALLFVAGCAGFFERKVDQRDQRITTLEYELEQTRTARLEALRRAEAAETAATQAANDAAQAQAEVDAQRSMVAAATTDAERQRAGAAVAVAEAKRQTAIAAAQARMAEALRQRELAASAETVEGETEAKIEDEEAKRETEVAGVIGEQQNRQALLMAIIASIAGGLRTATVLAGKAT